MPLKARRTSPKRHTFYDTYHANLMYGRAVQSDLGPFVKSSIQMTPPKRTYYSKFVFSLKAIIPDLEDDVAQVKKELASKGHNVDEDSIFIAWVMFQLERHLYLHLQLEGQHAVTHHLQSLIGNAFFYRHEVARNLLLSQIRPTLSREGHVAYLDRMCNAEIRLPDLRLNFL